MTALSFFTAGVPAAQGSKRAVRNVHTGRVALIESSKRVRPWREAVKHAALDAREDTGHQMFTGPVWVTVHFFLPRPKGHSRTGRNAHLLRDSAPSHPAGKPDLDKLVRTLDALTEAAVWRDDAQVVGIDAGKFYAEAGELVGARFYISDEDPDAAEAWWDVPAARHVEDAVVQEVLL